MRVSEPQAALADSCCSIEAAVGHRFGEAADTQIGRFGSFELGVEIALHLGAGKATNPKFEVRINRGLKL